MSKNIIMRFVSCVLFYDGVMSRILIFVYTVVCLSFSFPVSAASPGFIFPVACTLGHDCWSVHYVDVDPADGAAQDFICGVKTYDAHKGTDFALASVARMQGGVDVFAAAPGKILRFRDGESDDLKSDDELSQFVQDGKECGNGVLIDHGEGLQTIYCHLRKGSIVVKPGQNVRAGQKIAQVGQSGFAAFPHLHFGVLKDTAVVDPYTGHLNSEGCGLDKVPMWHMGLPMRYERGAIYDGGFRSQVPDFQAIRKGEENSAKISLNSAIFTFWAAFYNVEQGDKITMRIVDPDGDVFLEDVMAQPKRRDQQFYYIGRKIGKVALKPGEYTGWVRLERVGRGDPFILERTFSVQAESF